MQPDPLLGVVLHAIGGLAAASFYLPYKRVAGWSWETYWLAGGVFSWVVAPWIAALLLVPATLDVLAAVPAATLWWTFSFGAAWGVGGLMFGLTMRYLGIALGYAIALGLCAVFGTLMPPLVAGDLLDVAATTSGRVMLLGVVLCVCGIAAVGWAGVLKEREQPSDVVHETVAEFSFARGLLVALVAGVMSAAMAYGFAAGKPIAERAVAAGVPPVWQNLPVLVVVLLGGFATNLVWCGLRLVQQRRLGEFFRAADGADRVPLARNHLLCAAAGVLWYLQFFFYGMGTTKMGAYDFSSWTLHMASIIAFSTIWGLALREWRGTSRTTVRWLGLGLLVLVASTVVIGWGNELGAS